MDILYFPYLFMSPSFVSSICHFDGLLLTSDAWNTSEHQGQRGNCCKFSNLSLSKLFCLTCCYFMVGRSQVFFCFIS